MYRAPSDGFLSISPSSNIWFRSFPRRSGLVCSSLKRKSSPIIGERPAALTSCSSNTFWLCYPLKSSSSEKTCRKSRSNVYKAFSRSKSFNLFGRRINTTITKMIIFSVLQSRAVLSLFIYLAKSIGAKVYHWHKLMSKVCLTKSIAAKVLVVLYHSPYIHPSLFYSNWNPQGISLSNNL